MVDAQLVPLDQLADLARIEQLVGRAVFVAPELAVPGLRAELRQDRGDREEVTADNRAGRLLLGDQDLVGCLLYTSDAADE